MLAEKIKYTDYNGIQREETFYFNLNKIELLELEIGTSGGLVNYAQKLLETQDYKLIMSIFKNIVLTAYGEKSDDGKHFAKNKELSDAFEHSEAFSELFTRLLNDSEYLVKFITSIVPAEVASNMDTSDILAANPTLSLTPAATETAE